MIGKMPLVFKLIFGIGAITVILGLFGLVGLVYKNDVLCYTIGTIIGYTKLLVFPIGLILILSIFKEAITTQKTKTYTTQNYFKEKSQQDYCLAATRTQRSIMDGTLDMTTAKIKQNEANNSTEDATRKRKPFHIHIYTPFAHIIKKVKSLCQRKKNDTSQGASHGFCFT